MAKRFRDTALWEKEWYCSLSPVDKCFFDYLLSHCDNCGVWYVNKKLAEFQIGGKIQWEEIDKRFNGNIIFIAENKIFIKDFITFQYGELKETCVPHRNIFKLLEKHAIRYPIDTLSIVYRGSIDTLKDKEKEKDKYKALKAFKATGKFSNNIEFTIAWNNFVTMRKEIKKPVTQTAAEELLSRLEKYEVSVAIGMLKKSTENNWQGVFELKERGSDGINKVASAEPNKYDNIKVTRISNLSLS